MPPDPPREPHLARSAAAPPSTHALPLRWSDLTRLAWLSVPIWVFDINARRHVWANPAGLELWSATELSELQARDYSDMSEAAVTRFHSALAEMATGKVLHEQWTLYPRGKPTTVSVTRVAVVLEDGTLASLQQAAAAALVDAATLRGVEALHHTNVRVAMFRDDGSSVMQNPAAVRVFGVFEEGEDAFARILADPEEIERARALVAGGDTYSAELALRTVDGPKWHGLDARRALDPVTGAPLILINARDIEDRRAAELALLESIESQKRFLTGMSHEIRTPLNSVVGFVDLLRSTQLTEQQRRYAGNAHIASQHLLALVSDVLDLSKIEADQLEIAREELDLEDVLLESLVIASTRVRPTVELNHRIPELDTFVFGDPVRLKQIFVNLLGNSAKFTEKGYVRLVLDLPEQQAAGKVGISVTIEDSGIGIPEEKLADLFAPFRQAHGPTRGGTGLGLYLSRSLARKMGGDILVQSAVGRGSRFTVKLLLERAQSRLDGLQVKGRRALVLTHDHEVAQMLPERFLRAQAEVVCPARPSSADALRLCLDASPPFDVVIVDMDISPSVRSLVGVMRELSPGAKLIALVTPPDTAEVPVDAVLVKPFTFYRLAKLLEEQDEKSRKSAAQSKLALTGMRILVVEDVEINVSLLQETFRLWFGLGFDVARDGLEAVEKVRGSGYDLVLMDMQMPRLDGIEATRRIRALGARVPIVALTANAMSEDIERAHAAGMDGYVTKPVRREDLERVLRRHAPGPVSPRSRQPRIPRPPADVPSQAPEIRFAKPPELLVDVARRHFEDQFGAARAARLLAGSMQGVRELLADLEHPAPGDPSAFARTLHSLKGLLFNSGLVGMGERVAVVEQQVKKGGAPSQAELEGIRADLQTYVREVPS